MKSPFPGMDPFIEGCGLWEDFHGHLIEDVGRYLTGVVPERYLVRTGERNYVVLASEESSKRHPFKPDVSITSHHVDREASTAVVEAAADPDELTMQAFVEEEFRETFIEIQDGDADGSLVTCIEVLSPSNKKPNSVGWDQYLRKRQGILQSRSANLIEIDLLRGGQRMPMVESWPNSPYTLLTARKKRMPACQVRAAHFRKPVPTIAVPLLTPDADVPLELQPMIDAIYASFRYWRSIDYSQTLSPPLSVEDRNWLDQHLSTSSNA